MPSILNYRDIGGAAEHIGGTWDVESGGVATVKSGGTLAIAAGATFSLAGGASFVGDILYDTGVITVSNAELLALNATPKQLVAALGANKVCVPVIVSAKCVFLTAAFDNIAAGEDLAVRFTDGSGAILMTMEATGFLDQGTDQTRQQCMGASMYTPVANTPVVLHMTSGEIATGGGSLKVRMLYRIVDIALA